MILIACPLCNGELQEWDKRNLAEVNAGAQEHSVTQCLKLGGEQQARETYCILCTGIRPLGKFDLVRSVGKRPHRSLVARIKTWMPGWRAHSWPLPGNTAVYLRYPDWLCGTSPRCKCTPPSQSGPGLSPTAGMGPSAFSTGVPAHEGLMGKQLTEKHTAHGRRKVSSTHQ